MGFFQHLLPSSNKPVRYVLAALLLMLTPGCRGDQPEAGAASGEPVATVGVSVMTLTHPFFQDMVRAMQEEAEANNFELIINSCEFDVARQKNQVSDYLVRQADAIVVVPCDSKSIGTAVAEANAAGVPVFTADVAVLADGADVVAHIATNNYEGGKLAGEAVLEAINRSGQIAIIDHPEVESVIQRTRGFMEVIDAAKESGANVEVVARLPGGGTKDRAFRAAEDILQAHPDLDAIFAINDDTALGSVAAIEKAGKSGDVKVVGFDGTPEARRNIRDGKIHADVIQHPAEIGRRTIRAIADYMAGEQVAPETLIPASLYRQADAQADTSLQAAPTASR